MVIKDRILEAVHVDSSVWNMRREIVKHKSTSAHIKLFQEGTSASYLARVPQLLAELE